MIGKLLEDSGKHYKPFAVIYDYAHNVYKWVDNFSEYNEQKVNGSFETAQEAFEDADNKLRLYREIWD